MFFVFVVIYKGMDAFVFLYYNVHFTLPKKVHFTLPKMVHAKLMITICSVFLYYYCQYSSFFYDRFPLKLGGYAPFSASNNLRSQNDLFCGNDEAAENMSVVCSLLATCKAHDVKPRDYLNFIIAKMPYMQKASYEELLELLPHKWKESSHSNK
jgi:hypothetical protein